MQNPITVAEGKNPIAHTAEEYMSQPVVTVRADAPLDEVVSTMEKHRIRRVPESPRVSTER